MALEHHNCHDVAALIYLSAPELFSVLFGNRAIAHLAAFVGRSRTRFSHQYIRVATLNQQIVGMISLVPAIAVQDQADYAEVLSPVERAWVAMVNGLLIRHFVRHDFPAHGLYISNLAVLPDYRNQGIGRQLLTHCIDQARSAARPLFISVDVNNPNAQKLYETVGFRVQSKHTVALFGRAIGAHSMALRD